MHWNNILIYSKLLTPSWKLSHNPPFMSQILFKTFSMYYHYHGKWQEQFAPKVPTLFNIAFGSLLINCLDKRFSLLLFNLLQKFYMRHRHQMSFLSVTVLPSIFVCGQWPKYLVITWVVVLVLVLDTSLIYSVAWKVSISQQSLLN